jgi:hypothetical protein
LVRADRKRYRHLKVDYKYAQYLLDMLPFLGVKSREKGETTRKRLPARQTSPKTPKNPLPVVRLHPTHNDPRGNPLGVVLFPLLLRSLSCRRK